MSEYDDNQTPADPVDPSAPAEASDEQPLPAAPVEPPAPPAAVAPGAPPKQRWRDRVFSFRSMLAVTLAGLVLGAGAGVGISAVAGHDDRPDFGHHQMRSPGDDRGFPGRGGFGDGNGQDRPGPGQNGQIVPPGTAPQQQEDSSGDSSEAPSSS